ncbi:unnamed protein product [Danaus chrysippus]|uniref:(African queen) hypothetical protein n=1 Tax=Danaus chrysippus TaxID=151541 RepID=A0A8J2QRK4_9NEOP|nr:unnamed protein product [Danaus chrysippus]
MAKDDNRSAAGLRRSAIAERLRLREEWSALKEIDNTINQVPIQRNITKKQHGNLVIRFPKTGLNSRSASKKHTPRHDRASNKTSEILRGLVVHVDIGSESKALALRAALMALGASVVPQWSNLVTHLVWSEGGSRDVRSKARLLACKLVSPLWVEACAAANRRLPEGLFPAASRPSDLPSPNSLKRMLKRFELENITLGQLSDSASSDNNGRLRISSDSDTNNKSEDRSKDKTEDSSSRSPDVAVRVNTAPRRVLPLSPQNPTLHTRCKRKLFTHKEADTQTGSDTDIEQTPIKQKTPKKPQARRQIDKQLLRKIIGTENILYGRKEKDNVDKRLRFVLTGMSRQERQEVVTIIKKFNDVMLMFPFLDQNSQECDNKVKIDKPRTINTLLGAVRGCRVLYSKWVFDSMKENRWIHHFGYEVKHLKKIYEKARAERSALQKNKSEYAYNVFNGIKIRITNNAQHKDAITQLVTLCGAKIVNGGECDITIGINNGEICSKWIFDSIAAARLRTTRLNDRPCNGTRAPRMLNVAVSEGRARLDRPGLVQYRSEPNIAPVTAQPPGPLGQSAAPSDFLL